MARLNSQENVFLSNCYENDERTSYKKSNIITLKWGFSLMLRFYLLGVFGFCWVRNFKKKTTPEDDGHILRDY